MREAIEFSSYRQKAQQERLAYVGEVLSQVTPSLSPEAKRRAGALGVALVVATGAFWATMLTSPPKSEAALPQGIDINRLSSAADPDMATFEDKYQRHTGVLDVLKP